MIVYRVYDCHGRRAATCTGLREARLLAAAVGGWWQPVARKPTVAELHCDLKVAA